MSLEEKVAAVGATIVAVLSWLLPVRVWRQRLDMGRHQGRTPGTPRSAAYHAALGPVVGFVSVVMTVVWGLVVTDWLGAPDAAASVLWWTFVASFCLWPLAGSLYLFLRPRFLVPPHLRGQSTVAGTMWRGRRTRAGVPPRRRQA